MKTTTFNHNVYSNTHTSIKYTGKKASIADKLRSYWNENQKTIICGMAAVNPNVDVNSIFRVLNS